MSYQLIFHPVADEEYRDAYLRYEWLERELGDRFEKMVEQRIQQIMQYPENYHISKGSYREVAVEDFPYSIVYRLNKRKKLIYVSSVYHNKRHPKGKYRK